MAETTRLQLPHPGVGTAPVDIPADFAALAERLATIVVGYLETTLAERPAASATLVGYLHWATDDEVLTWCTGAAWVEIGSGVGVEPLTQAEIDALVGDDLFDGRLVFNKTTRNFQEYRDPPAAWITQQLIHVGPTPPANPRPYMVWIDTSDNGVPVTTSHAALQDLEVGDPHPQYMTEQEVADAIANGSSGLSQSLPAGRYLTSPGLRSAAAAAIPRENAWAIPFPLAIGGSVDRIACEVTGAQADTVVRMGIYASGPNGLPGALVVDAGTVSADTTGAKEITLSPAVELAPGFYWLVAVTQGAADPSLTRVAGYGARAGSATLSQALQDTRAGVRVSGVGGALPDPFGAVSDVTTPNWPLILVRGA